MAYEPNQPLPYPRDTWVGVLCKAVWNSRGIPELRGSLHSPNDHLVRHAAAAAAVAGRDGGFLQREEGGGVRENNDDRDGA